MRPPRGGGKDGRASDVGQPHTPRFAAAAVSDVSRAGARTAWVATALGLLTAAFVIGKTGRDALYFQGRGLYDLPRAYMAIAFLALPMASVVLLTMPSCPSCPRFLARPRLLTRL